jgi:hypothetical protein
MLSIFGQALKTTLYDFLVSRPNGELLLARLKTGIPPDGVVLLIT